MRIENGQIKDIVDPTDAQDAMTQNQATATAANIPRFNDNGVTKSSVIDIARSAVVSGGSVTFNLTTDNTPTGTALCTTVFKESMNWWVDDSVNQYQLGNYSLSADKKTLTLTVNKIGLSLGVLVFTSAANGITVNMTIKGI